MWQQKSRAAVRDTHGFREIEVVRSTQRLYGVAGELLVKGEVPKHARHLAADLSRNVHDSEYDIKQKDSNWLRNSVTSKQDQPRRTYSRPSAGAFTW